MNGYGVDVFVVGGRRTWRVDGKFAGRSRVDWVPDGPVREQIFD